MQGDGSVIQQVAGFLIEQQHMLDRQADLHATANTALKSGRHLGFHMHAVDINRHQRVLTKGFNGVFRRSDWLPQQSHPDVCAAAETRESLAVAPWP